MTLSTLPYVLYCSPDVSTLLIDLPTSIANAQASSRRLRSTSPPHQPYQTPEPKGKKRDQLLASIPLAELEIHRLIQSNSLGGLLAICSGSTDPRWCLDRCSVYLDRHSPSGISTQNRLSVNDNVSGQDPPLILSSIANIVCTVDDLRDVVVYNPASTTSAINVSDLGNFHIPPHSVFIQSTIEHGCLAFKRAIKYNLLGKVENVSSQGMAFDLVLLDPPWTNRSVRHSRAYLSAELQTSDPFQQAVRVLEECLDANGYVAIWITNKSKIRLDVIHEFSRLNLTLVEEWTWLKITDAGDPITPIDGIWRKPYELLLLFSRKSGQAEFKRRTVVAVPDVHSRKPCLKSLFEMFMPTGYRALEMFARSLVADWWSWGDEVLKFQHEENWT